MLEYLSQFSQPIAKTLQTIFLSLAVLTGANPSPVIINTPVQEVDLAPIEQKVNLLGANISALADFRTSLSSEISSSATSMTLESFTSGSDTLTVGKTYGFKLGGREYVLGEASTANTIINMTRGISRGTGTTTVAAYQSRWGRGTAVEITDAPVLIRAANILGGTQTIENTLKYDSTVATTTIDDDSRNLVNYELLTYTAFNGAGVIDASATQKGVVELATQIETASSTGNGSVGVLAIPASNATSTYNSATAALRVVTTQNSGKIDNNFIATSSGLFVNTILSGVTTSTGLTNIASTSFYATTTSGTWVKPSNLRYLVIEVCGGGGGGGGSTSANDGMGGGGGGGYSRKIIPTAVIGSTETVTIGAAGSAGPGSGGSGGTGGTTSFGSHIQATGGTGGSASGASAGGAGGVGSLGDLNINGQGGGAGIGVPAFSFGGAGGASYCGGGANGIANDSNSDATGVSAGNYGGGGGGAITGAGGDTAGGAGGPGVIFFTYVFY